MCSIRWVILLKMSLLDSFLISWRDNSIPIYWLFISRCHPALFSRCPVLEKNSRCLRRSFPLWSWTSQTFSLKVHLNSTFQFKLYKWSKKNRQSVQCLLCVLGPQQCIVCGNLAQEECTDCFKDPLFSKTGFKIFCNTCSDQVLVQPYIYVNKKL